MSSRIEGSKVDFMEAFKLILDEHTGFGEEESNERGISNRKEHSCAHVRIVRASVEDSNQLDLYC